MTHTGSNPAGKSRRIHLTGVSAHSRSPCATSLKVEALPVCLSVGQNRQELWKRLTRAGTWKAAITSLPPFLISKIVTWQQLPPAPPSLPASSASSAGSPHSWVLHKCSRHTEPVARPCGAEACSPRPSGPGSCPACSLRPCTLLSRRQQESFSRKWNKTVLLQCGSLFWKIES